MPQNNKINVFPPVTPKKPWWQEAITIFILFVITAALVGAVFYKVITQPGLAPGADTNSFAHSAKYTVDYFRSNHRFPSIDLNWYAGFEEQQAPPLITISLGTIYYFTHDIELSTRILTPLGIYLFFIIMFIVMKKEGYPTLNAWMAGIGYAFMPSILLTFGSYTKFMALMFLPPAFYFTNKILTSASHYTAYKYTALLALMIGLSLYGHPMNGFVFSFVLFCYAVIYAFLDSKINFRRVFFVAGGLVLGFAFASNYVIPFVLEKAGRTAVPSEESTFAYGFSDIYQSTIRNMAGGFSLFFLYVVWRYRNPKVRAVFSIALMTILICVLYMVFGLGKIFPFNITYAYIWTEVAGFFCAYLIGSIIGFKIYNNLADSILRVQLAFITTGVFIWFVNAQPFVQFRVFGPTSFNQVPGEYDLASAIQAYDSYGRMFPTHYPFGFLNWTLAMKTDKPNMEGHYFGISRISHQISVIADSMHNQYYDYVLRKLKDLNVRYVIANNTSWDIKADGVKVGQKFLSELATKANFNLVYTTPKDKPAGLTEWGANMNEEYRLFFNDKPSNYLVPINDKILVIGRFGTNIAAAVSSNHITMLEANDIYLDNYPLEFLQNFDTVVLYGFGYHDKAKAEQLAKDYVKGGGNLVVELFGAENSRIVENPDFLGVTGYPVKVKDKTDIQILDPTYKDKMINYFSVPAELFDNASTDLPRIPLKEWNALEYVNLDHPIASIPDDTNLFSIFGYKNLDGGKVTFVGFNLFYDLYITHNPKLLALATSILVPPDKTADFYQDQPETLQSEQLKITPQEFQFEVNNPSKKLAFISIAYTKHWHVYADKKELKVYPMEDLVAVELPPGNYTLTLRYGTTFVKNMSEVLTVGTFAGLMYLLIYCYVKKKKTNIQTD